MRLKQWKITTTVILIGLTVLILQLLPLQQFLGENMLENLGGTDRIPLAAWVEAAVDWMAIQFMPFFDAVSMAINVINNAMETASSVIPVYMIGFGSQSFLFPVWGFIMLPLLWWLSGNFSTGIFGFTSLWLIANFGLWPDFIETFSLVLTAAAIALAIGIPMGIISAISDRVNTLVRPVLDMMQTLPVFVYLIPAVIFFGMGAAPGVIATVIFATPPAVRLTNLGIREVPIELTEAGEAFGCSKSQLLFKVQIPTARSSIMAGVNQTIMMSLSMVVIAALIGAGGLGREVVKAIQRLLVGDGFVAGISVVFVAMILDRATSNIGDRSQEN